MHIFTALASFDDFINATKKAGKSIGFVPTMGALHQGHVSLIQKSLEENEITVCSIFVNPIQFTNAEDLARYPRTLDEDCRLLESIGCNAVFAPTVAEMYPQAPILKLDFGLLERVMEGEHRPGHFNGVGIVVARLFNVVRPDRAYFGQKDFQQTAIVRSLIVDLGFALKLVVCPTLREADGLAMSSRNRRLTDRERAIAPVLYQVLSTAQQRIEGGSKVSDVSAWAHQFIESVPEFALDYFEIVNSITLQPVAERQDTGQTVLCIAAQLGAVRLIDNVVF